MTKDGLIQYFQILNHHRLRKGNLKNNQLFRL